ncbi:thioredoxin family protein [Microbacteriaceae bacterium 4G12]
MKKLADIEQVNIHTQQDDMCLLFIKTANCGVCDAVFVKTERLLMSYPKIESIFVSLEELPQVSGEYLVFTAPTLLMFVRGKEVLRESRFIVFEKLEQNIKLWYEEVYIEE